jgi:hypothetical protein
VLGTAGLTTNAAVIKARRNGTTAAIKGGIFYEIQVKKKMANCFQFYLIFQIILLF